MYRMRCGRKQPRILVRALAVGAVIAVASAGTLLFSPLPAGAAGATLYVAGGGGDAPNDCQTEGSPCATIQYAVSQALAGDTIVLAAGDYPESVTIEKSVTLVGAGSDQTTIKGGVANTPSVTIDGTGPDGPPTVTIQDLAVSGNGSSDGIDVTAATLALQDCDVSGNDGDGVSLAPGVGAGAATATISDCSINDNGDDGIEVDGGSTVAVDHSTIDANGGGGIVVESGTATVGTSTLDHNVGAGVVADGTGAVVTVTDSTVSNTQPLDGEGNKFGGGVMVFPGGEATITTSTLSGNTGQGVLDAGGQVVVKNSTITGTQPGLDAIAPMPVLSGAVVFVPQGSATPPSLSGTLLADQNSIVPNCEGGITDSGYNLSDTDACAFTATGSVNSGVANLGALADNGGLTQTQLPGAGSDAIDAIPVGSAGCIANGTDQRGDPRLVGARCDIGAVEVAMPPVVIDVPTPPTSSSSPSPSSTSTATVTSSSPASTAAAPRVPTSSTVIAVASTTSTSGPGLANTGVDTVGMVLVGGAALVLGLGLMLWTGAFGFTPRRRH